MKLEEGSSITEFFGSLLDVQNRIFIRSLCYQACEALDQKILHPEGDKTSDDIELDAFEFLKNDSIAPKKD